MSEANQLIITSKKLEKYKEGTFGYFNFESTFLAWKELKPASFALYLFIFYTVFADNFSAFADILSVFAETTIRICGQNFP